MAYADSIRTTTCTMEDVATLIDGAFGASGPLGASTAWTITHTGFSANPTYVAQYWKIGRMVICTYNPTAVGTSNATGYTVTAPVTARTLAGMVWSTRLTTVYDNSAYSTSPGIAQIASAGTTISLLFNQNGSTLWTNAGNKLAAFTLIYEAAS